MRLEPERAARFDHGAASSCSPDLVSDKPPLHCLARDSTADRLNLQGAGEAPPILAALGRWPGSGSGVTMTNQRLAEPAKRWAGPTVRQLTHAFPTAATRAATERWTFSGGPLELAQQVAIGSQRISLVNLNAVDRGGLIEQIQ